MRQLKSLGEIKSFFDSVRTGQLVNFKGISGMDFGVDRGVLAGLTDALVLDKWDRPVYVLAHLENGVPNPQIIFQGEGHSSLSPAKDWIAKSRQGLAIIAKYPYDMNSPQGIFGYDIRNLEGVNGLECLGIPCTRKGDLGTVETLRADKVGSKVISWLPFRKERVAEITGRSYSLDGSPISGIRTESYR